MDKSWKLEQTKSVIFFCEWFGETHVMDSKFVREKKWINVYVTCGTSYE